MSAAGEMLQENATTVDRTLPRGFGAQSNKGLGAGIPSHHRLPKRNVKIVGLLIHKDFATVRAV